MFCKKTLSKVSIIWKKSVFVVCPCACLDYSNRISQLKLESLNMLQRLLLTSMWNLTTHVSRNINLVLRMLCFSCPGWGAWSEGSFLNGFLRLPEKLAPTLVLDLALFVPRHKVGAYASFKKLASGGCVSASGGLSSWVMRSNPARV
jgi:hypothetical protein